MCKECSGTGFKYQAFRDTCGGFVQCPVCNPPAPDPDWLQPMGQSNLHPTLMDTDGGALEL